MQSAECRGDDGMTVRRRSSSVHACLIVHTQFPSAPPRPSYGGNEGGDRFVAELLTSADDGMLEGALPWFGLSLVDDG